MRDGTYRTLTRTTRTALTTLCLGELLLTIRNIFRRAKSPTERGPWIEAPFPGYPREIKSSAHPFVRRDSATARQSCLGSARTRPAVHMYVSVPCDQRARDASGRRLQSTCQRRAPEQPRGSRIRDRGGPRPHRRTVLTRSDRPLWPGFRRPHGCFLPAEACHGTRSSDVSVTAPSPPGVTPVEPIRPRPLLPPLNVMSFGFHDPRHLRSIEELSSSPFPISDSAFRRTPVHDRCFARGGSEPPEARFRPRSQPQPEIAS
jgi:hypothetical protein